MKLGKQLLTTAASVSCVVSVPAMAQGTPAQPQTTTGNNNEAIIVTATRRAQTLLEVPQSVSVVSGQTLEQQQAKTFLDYSKLVPGLNITQDNPGQSRLILRGINTGSVGSTVANYVDDVPFGASGSLSNAAVLAGDFDTFDLDRIEVLRGPQGTLYGSNSLGGVLRFITKLPSTTRFEARGQAGFEVVKGGELGPLFNAMVNVPLGDTIAFRASGYFHKVPGYVETVGRSGKNVDDSKNYGVRGSLLFRPTQDLSIRLFALAQNIHADSPSSYGANPASLERVNPLTGLRSDGPLRFELIPEKHDIDYRMYSGTLDYDFGFAALTSITSYATQKQDQFVDVSTTTTRPVANLVYALTAPNTVGLGQVNNVTVKKFTQETRLVSPKAKFFDWVAGIYYTHEDTALDQELLPFTIATQAFIPTATTVPNIAPPLLGGQHIDRFVTANIHAKYKEIAGYVNGTFHFTDRFDLNLGGRYSHNKQSSEQSVIQLGLGSPQSGDSSQGVFTWNVSPRFELNDNTAIYARVAKGYRPGGPNFVPPGAPADFPTEFEADTLISYETGIKAQSSDGVFSADASAFYVNWDNILILTSVTVQGTPVGVNANGQKARTYGVEGTFTVRPMVGLDLSANLAWTKAYLRGDTTNGTGLNLTGGLDGDHLPFIPKLSATFAADYRWDLTDSVKAFAGATFHTQSDQKGGFNAAYRARFGRQINLEGYSTFDLHGGIDLKPFTVEAYVRNLFNSNGLVNASYPQTIATGLGGTGQPLATATSVRPRTIGVNVGARF
jgi:outer membrane receptor protein involved in Fe transport